MPLPSLDWRAGVQTDFRGIFGRQIRTLGGFIYYVFIMGGFYVKGITGLSGVS